LIFSASSNAGDAAAPPALTTGEGTPAAEGEGPSVGEAPVRAFRLARPLEAFGAFDLSILVKHQSVIAPGADMAFVQTRFTPG
jgi:hypothetical protein